MSSSQERAFAVVAPGLETTLAAELKGLGASPREVEGGCEFTASRPLLYRVHLHTRIAARVWVRLGEFPAVNLEALAAGARALPWSRYVTAGRPVAVRVSSHRSRLRHANAVAAKVEHAIRDALRGPRRTDQARPVREPLDVLIRIVDDRVEASVDASGENLHRRGWRKDIGEAPLRENLAAAVLALADWDPDEPLVDPMCGSGTLPIEAATIAAGRPPGRDRTFAFQTWPSHDAEAWTALRREHGAVGRAVILGADRDPEVLRAAEANARRAGVADRVRFEACDVAALEAPTGRPGLVVCNPPYGARIRGADAAWGALGRTLRERFDGWRVALLVPEGRLLSKARLRLPRVASFTNGGLRVAVHVGAIGSPV